MSPVRQDPLPQPGIAVESVLLEFKREFSSGFAAAKSVAALANARGGSIIVGAVHNQQTGRLVKFVETEPGKTEKLISDAVVSRCSPAPVYRCVPQQAADGVRVVAIYVEPHMSGALIAVRLKSADPEHRADGWVVPMRVGSDTTYLNPGEWPMYLDARLRRAVVLLGQIGPFEPVTLMPERTSHGGAHPQPERGSVNGFNEAENTFTFGVQRRPLDRIESVYRDDNGWVIVYRFYGPGNVTG
jgi:hypothetical protein